MRLEGGEDVLERDARGLCQVAAGGERARAIRRQHAVEIEEDGVDHDRPETGALL